MICFFTYSRRLSRAGAFVLASLASSCGGGGSHANTAANTVVTTGSNVQPISVNAGPTGSYANGVFTSVTVCIPSTTNCQTIDSVLVDTGSYGLRLLSSAGGGTLTLSLPQQDASDGNPIGECAGFVSGLTWGPVKTADITLSGKQASNVPVQVIDPTFATVPAACASSGVPEDDTLQALGSNGILGIGPFAQDCGSACTATGATNPGLYWDCASTSCQVTAESLTAQVQNPVPLFATDNNGVIIELPSLSGSAATLSGSLVFGIGTQSNNTLGSAAIFPLDSNGEFNTTFKGQTYPAFVDSGSNALFFLNSALTGLPACSASSGFYCPASQTNLTAATISGSVTANISFAVANADALFSTPTDAVFAPLAGPNPGMFDWGLPFFFGRNVFTAIESKTTPGGNGPYWAY